MRSGGLDVWFCPDSARGSVSSADGDDDGASAELMVLPQRRDLIRNSIVVDGTLHCPSFVFRILERWPVDYFLDVGGHTGDCFLGGAVQKWIKRGGWLLDASAAAVRAFRDSVDILKWLDHVPLDFESSAAAVFVSDRDGWFFQAPWGELEGTEGGLRVLVEQDSPGVLVNEKQRPATPDRPNYSSISGGSDGANKNGRGGKRVGGVVLMDRGAAEEEEEVRGAGGTAAIHRADRAGLDLAAALDFKDVRLRERGGANAMWGVIWKKCPAPKEDEDRETLLSLATKREAGEDVGVFGGPNGEAAGAKTNVGRGGTKSFSSTDCARPTRFVTADSYITERGFVPTPEPRIGIRLKVSGTGLEVLRGMRDVVLPNAAWITVFVDQAGTYAEMRRILEDAGFRVTRVGKIDKATEFDLVGIRPGVVGEQQ